MLENNDRSSVIQFFLRSQAGECSTFSNLHRLVKVEHSHVSDQKKKWETSEFVNIQRIISWWNNKLQGITTTVLTQVNDAITTGRGINMIQEFLILTAKQSSNCTEILPEIYNHLENW
ncbi:hypothetical protein CIHG_10309 [Coccidioides immitis H538.4]|uniref:Uncharacterized protein n=1 Tax=Coccidioides immitis H538.4 TaxID=396776 RepID=A0A0J8S6E0_COCIT|nr:hypothetical protein CIHG_10309 [Coccidioides immitis H538.4]